MDNPLDNPKSQCYYCRKSNPSDKSHKVHFQCNCSSCNYYDNRKKYPLEELEERFLICDQCYKAKTQFTSSGNKVIDEFIMETLTIHDKMHGEMEFVPSYKFKDLEFIAEGGFSKIYKATWIDGPIIYWNREKQKYNRQANKTVALKELNSNSKNFDTKELNEIKIFHILFNNTIWKRDFNKYINKYYGITQHPDTKNYMIIMNYYESGDLTHYLAKDFFNINWNNKLSKLCNIISGLQKIHDANILHHDYDSGNIFVEASKYPIIGDLGLSKSAIESSNDENKEVYGIIPYVAPEIFKGQKYTKASDIYSFGMIMWELMIGRRPFWDKSHDTDLIIKIWDGLRPPIVTNAPEGYVKLMKKCWHSDPNKRPTAKYIYKQIHVILEEEWKYKYNPTKIVESSAVGPITTNNLDAIFKSRPLSTMIKSAVVTINLKIIEKRKFDEFFENDEENDENDIKKIKYENNDKNNGYLTREFEFEFEFDIEININKFDNNDLYITKEIKFDI